MFRNMSFHNGRFSNFRLAIDLGIPVVNVKTMMTRVAQEAGTSEEYNHEFFLKAKQIIESKDNDRIIKEKLV